MEDGEIVSYNRTHTVSYRHNIYATPEPVLTIIYLQTIPYTHALGIPCKLLLFAGNYCQYEH